MKLVKNKNNYKNLIKQTEIHLNANELSQAITCVMQAIESDPTRMDGYYWRGSVFRRTNEEEDMLKDANTLLACTASTALHFAYRGWAYCVKNEYDLAIAECSEALRQNATLKEGYYYRSWAYYYKHEIDRAIEDNSKAIEIDPKYAAAYSNRGLAYRGKGDLDLAIEDFDKAIEFNSKYAIAYSNRGLAYRDKGNLDLAIEDFNKAIEINSKYAVAYSNRGLAYGDKGDLDLAIEDYNKAIEINPKNARFYNYRGVTYKNKGDLDRATEDFDKAMEIDQKYTLAQYNRRNIYRIEDQKMRLLGIRNNRKYLDELKDNIKNVVPFLGAGVSIPYGYYSWKTLLLEILNRCSHVREEDVRDKKEKIAKYIDDGYYIKAANELDNIFTNLSSTVCHVIERIARAKPITEKNAGLLGEYLHLFPNSEYLTTNFDTVVQDILQFKCQTKPVVATLNQDEQPSWDYLSFPSQEEGKLKKEMKKAKVYYLHGLFTESNSITLSEAHYNDYYGEERNIKSNLRRLLPKALRRLHNRYTFLYIGCSMAIKEDRILRLLREFYGHLLNYPCSYALLNTNEVANSEVPYENWVDLDVDKQKELNTKLDRKEDELEDMNVRIIWYSASKDEEHELAKHELFEYILNNILQYQELILENEKRELDSISERKKIIEKQMWQPVESVPSGENEVDSEITTSAMAADEFFSSQEHLKQIEEFFQINIQVAEGTPAKYLIELPMYNICGGLYKIYLVSKNGKFHLSDDGATYAELDKIFELKEPDVIKNLVAVLKQYGCQKQQGTNAFIINCTLQDVHIKTSYLIQAISFMLNMKIFYV